MKNYLQLSIIKNRWIFLRCAEWVDVFIIELVLFISTKMYGIQQIILAGMENKHLE
jgi:hypothetical protein